MHPHPRFTTVLVGLLFLTSASQAQPPARPPDEWKPRVELDDRTFPVGPPLVGVRPTRVEIEYFARNFLDKELSQYGCLTREGTVELIPGIESSKPGSEPSPAKWIARFGLVYKKDVVLNELSSASLVLFEDGRLLSRQLRNVPKTVDDLRPRVPADQAVVQAVRAFSKLLKTDNVRAAGRPSRPILLVDGSEGRLSWLVDVTSPASGPNPRGVRSYYVSAVEPGRIFYWVDRQHRAYGVVTGLVWKASPLEEPVRVPLPEASVRRVDGFAGSTDSRGRFIIPGAGTATFVGLLQNPYIRVVDNTGATPRLEKTTGAADDQVSIPLDFGKSGEADDALGLACRIGVCISVDLGKSTEADVAQTTAFYWAEKARRFAGALGENDKLKGLIVRVNLPPTHLIPNIYYDRFARSLNIERSAHPAEGEDYPSAASPSLVCHEYAHVLDDCCGGILDAALSEGIADAWAMLVTRDPVIGRDALGKGTSVRDLRAVVSYESDDSYRQGHAFAGFVWDLVRALEAADGPDAGYGQTRDLLKSVISLNVASIPEAVLWMLRIDDDDNDLSNGTPHSVQILHAARAHKIPVPAEVGSKPVTTGVIQGLPAPLGADAPPQPYPPRGAPAPLGTGNSRGR